MSLPHPTPPGLQSRSYSLGAVLGAGSFGVVRECTDRRTGRRFAVKSINKVRSGTDGLHVVVAATLCLCETPLCSFQPSLRMLCRVAGQPCCYAPAVNLCQVPKNARATPRYLLKIQTEVDAMQQLGGSLDAVFLQVCWACYGMLCCGCETQQLGGFSADSSGAAALSVLAAPHAANLHPHRVCSAYDVQGSAPMQPCNHVIASRQHCCCCCCCCASHLLLLRLTPQDVFEDDVAVHLVMELCEGGSVLDGLKDGEYSERQVGGLLSGSGTQGGLSTSCGGGDGVSCGTVVLFGSQKASSAAAS